MSIELINKTFINSRKDFIETFLEEIKSENYETMAQVRGALYISLDVLENLEKSHEYEKAVKLDNLTDEE